MSTFYESAMEKYVAPKISELIPGDANGWDLYSTKDGSAAAADELSTSLRAMLTDLGARYLGGMRQMDALMAKHSQLGACDSEPIWALKDAVQGFMSYLANELV